MIQLIFIQPVFWRSQILALFAIPQQSCGEQLLNLTEIYPFLNALGLLFLATTGFSMWLQKRPSAPSQRQV